MSFNFYISTCKGCKKDIIQSSGILGTTIVGQRFEKCPICCLDNWMEEGTTEICTPDGVRDKDIKYDIFIKSINHKNILGSYKELKNLYPNKTWLEIKQMNNFPIIFKENLSEDEARNYEFKNIIVDIQRHLEFK